MRLLWVENHPVFARLAGKQFLADHDLVIVGSLAEARRLLAEQAFDVVLLDYDLDDGKGTSLIGSIQQLAPRPVVIAASAHEGGNEALRLAGADAVCRKTRFAEIRELLTGVVAAKCRAEPEV
jgi:CheY-like chemotaxis protein